jgi:hypothetical protein
MAHLAGWFVVCASLLYFFSYPEVDPDLWGHLFFGREIVQSGTLPSSNLYSFTASNHPWINHEWLAEVVFYALFYLAGSSGLILFKVVIGAVVVWILDFVIRKRFPSALARVLTLIWAMAILSPGFNIRPQLFTFLLLAFLLLLFHLYETGRRRILYGAPLLMLFWVNLHGGFAAGLGAWGLFAAAALFRTVRQGRGNGQASFQIVIPLALSVLVLMLNPYGPDLLLFLWKDIMLDRLITEWRAIPLFDASFLEFKLAFFALAFLSARKASYRRWEFFLSWLAFFLALRHQRHTPLFAIIAAPLLAEVVEAIALRLQKSCREWILAVGFTVAAIYLLQGIGRIHWAHGFRLVVNPLEYPTQAADFLQRNGIRGNLVLPFDWGEYLIWKFYPEARVSIDGRYTTAYPMEIIQQKWDWMEGKKGWRKLLERYPAELAITNRYHPVTALMRKDPEWVYIYSDPVAFIFVRKVSSQDALLEKFKEKRLLPARTPSLYFPG